MKNVLLLLSMSAMLIAAVWLMKFEKDKTVKPSSNQHLEEDGDAPYGEGEHGEKVLYEFNRLKNPFTGEVPKHIREKEIQFAATLPKKDEFARSLNWLSRGPNNFGGRTRAFATDIANEQILLAGGVSSGIYRSTNGGATFSPTFTPLQMHSTTCLAQDTRAGKTATWYCGTGEYYGVVSAASFSNLSSGNGIYKSTDNGLHWTLLPSTVSNTPTTHLTYGDFDAVWDIVCDNHDASNDVVLAAVYGGVKRSTDGGATWSTVLGLDSTGGISDYVDLMQTPSGVFYAALASGGLDKGIWRSTDGTNWTNITPGGFGPSYDGIQMAFAPSDETKIYIIANTPGAGFNNHQLWFYHYISGVGTGAGGTWANRTANLPMEHCTGYFSFDFGIFSSQSSYDMCIAVKPDNPDFVLLCGTNVYRSLDGFSTTNHDWIGGYLCDTVNHSNYVYPNHHPDQHTIFFSASNPKKVYSANDGGIFYAPDITASPMNWESMNNSYLTTQFYTVAVQPGNTSSDIVIGGLQDNGTFYTNSINPFSIWKHIFIGDGAFCSITHPGKIYYLSIQQGKIYKCDVASDGTVTSYTRMDPKTGTGYLFINPFILDPNNDNVMYMAGGRYIWRNDSLSAIPIINDAYNAINTGWKKLTGTNTGVGFSAPTYTAIAMSEASQNKLYLGTDNGDVFVIDSVKSGVGARRKISDSTLSAGAYLSSIATDKYDANKVMISYSNYGVKSIFYSENGGGSWTNISGNLEQNPDGTGDGPSVMWVHLYHDEDTTIYFAGTSTGLYATSALNGLSTVWTQEGSGTVGNIPVNMITSRTHDGLIAIGTHGKGVYTTRLKSTLSIEKLTTENLFIKAYPNPFADYAVINFYQPTEAMMDITIYNLGGQTIRNLYHKTTLQGTDSIVWDAKDNQGIMVPAGHYIAVLQCGSLMKQAMLVKY